MILKRQRKFKVVKKKMNEMKRELKAQKQLKNQLF